MAYTAKKAIQTAYEYLGISEENVKKIRGTDSRGIVCTVNGEMVVIFIYPISCKAGNVQNFFDTRDSGAKERKTAWEYAKTFGYKYFCFGFNSEQERYKDYVLSLESSEDKISSISFRSAKDNDGTGTQVNIPNDFIPNEPFQRVITHKGFFISAIKREIIWEYINIFDSRPYCEFKHNADLSIKLSDDPENNEKQFKTWMFTQEYKPDTLYVEETINNYSSWIKDAVSELGINDMVDHENLFEVYSFYEMSKIMNLMMQQPNFEEKNEGTNRFLKNGLIAYLKFLRCFSGFTDDVEDDSDVFNFNVKINKNFGYDNNRIIFGAPGTGKSFFVKSEKKKLLGENSVDFERVTFHSDYSYAQFVGTYKPVSYEDEDGNKKIEYKFVPGPFARILCKALKNIKESVKENGMIDNSSVKPYLLIIEEINRAKTSAVFGDVFQLLDRDNNGLSEYSINPSEDLKKYLAKELEVGLDSVDSIRIPSNMFIWATMNSADQGVFPMDTAFKRRWNFAYTDVDSSANENEFSFIVKGEEIEWNAIRKAINDVLCGETIRAHEDKLLGAFFMKKIKDSVSEEETEENKKVREEKNNVIYVRNFTDKVLMYLFDDVAKTHRDAIFDVQVVNRFRFSSVKEKFLDQGLAIFSKDVNDKYKSYLTGKKVEK